MAENERADEVREAQRVDVDGWISLPRFYFHVVSVFFQELHIIVA